MRSFFILLTWTGFVSVFFNQSVKILNIGDSFDRISAVKMCQSMGKSVTSWTDDKLTYNKGDTSGGYHCAIPEKDSSFANLMVFGSNDTRPYWVWEEKITPTNIIDTKDRMHYALNLYLDSFPPPDFIYFHTVLWDWQYYLRIENEYWEMVNVVGSLDYNISINIVRNNYKRRLDEIRQVLHQRGLSDTTRLALRSGVHIPDMIKGRICEKGKKELIHGYNQLLREMAQDMNITFYDFHTDIWSAAKYDYRRCDLMRDRHHITDQLMVARTKKMLGLQYSNLLTIRSESTKQQQLLSSTPSLQILTQPWFRPNSRNDGISILKEVYLIKVVYNHTTSIVYYVSYDGNLQHPIRHAHAHPNFQTAIRLGFGDIYTASLEEIKYIPESYPVPSEFQENENWFRGVIVRLMSFKPNSYTLCDYDENESYEYFLLVLGAKRPIVRVKQGDKFNHSVVENTFPKNPELVGRKIVNLHWNFLEYVHPLYYVLLDNTV